MISKVNRTIAFGSSRLDYHKIVVNVVNFLDGNIVNFPQYLTNSDSIKGNEKGINSCLVTYLNILPQNHDLIDLFRFYFDKDTQVEGSNHEPDLGVMLANQIGRGKAFFHIECKRLPSRDKKHEQEYVHGALGGIQRFKEGYHGSTFSDSAMVGYVEKETKDYWFTKINQWIDEQSINNPNFWHCSEKLNFRFSESYDKLISTHKRKNLKENINLFHYLVLI